MEAIKYIVGIQCMTYNHSRYILDTLNGFVLQETNFPYIILLVDDASTDGTPDIIGKYIEQHFNLNDNIITGRTETEYAHILYTQHKTNKNCHIVSMSLKYNHYQIGRKADKLRYLSEWINDCKYMALCEGDDYWIDSNKLKNR